MKPNRRSQLLRLANVTLAAPAAWAVLSASAQAGSATWANTGTNWNADASWTPFTGYPGVTGTTDIATFTGAMFTQPAVSAPVTIGGVTFSDAAASGYAVSGSALTLTNVGTGATTSAVHSANTSGTNTISNAIVLGGNAATTARFNQGTAGTLALNGAISSTNAITGVNFQPISNTVTSAFTLAGNNTYNGTSTLGFATFNVNHAGAFSTGTVIYGNNPRFNNTSGAPVTIANAQTIGTNFTYSGADANSNLTFSGNLDMSGGSRTVDTLNAGGKLTFSGAVNVGAGTRQQNKSGPGTLALTGTMTGTGLNQTIATVVYNNSPWRVNAGFLEVSNAAVLGDTLDFRGGLQASTPLTLPTTIVHANNNATIGGSNNITLSGAYILSNGADSRVLNITNTGSTTFSGTISLTDTAGDATQTLTVNADGSTGTNLISGVIQNRAGGGTTTNPMGFTKSGFGDLTLSNANTFTGTLTVNAGRLIATNAGAFGSSGNTINVAGGTLMPDGNLTYVVNGPLTVGTGGTLRLGVGSTSGVNDKIGGIGPVSLNGPLMIDVPEVNPPDGATFQLFNQAVTYLGSFVMTDASSFWWTGSVASGRWSYTVTGGVYTYNQASRILTFTADLDGDGLSDTWEKSFFPGDLTKLTSGGDYDNDGYYDEQEYAGGSNPNNAASVPGDIDGDSLSDAWEYTFYPGDLNQLSGLGGADKDGDGVTDLAEYTGNSSPADANWKPNKASLKHRWSFTTGAGQLNDSVGTAHATIVNPGAANPATFSGNAVTLAGGAKASSEAINLGANLISEGFPVTIELWATQNAVQNNSRIFDFNSNNTTEYLSMNWTDGGNLNADKVEWKDLVTSNPVPATTNAPYLLGQKYHIVMSLIPAEFTSGGLVSGTRVVWYKAPADGPSSHAPLWTQRGTFDTTNNLSQLNDAIGALGQAASGDNTASATYDEVRIWHGVLTETEREVAQAVGTGVTDLTTDADGDGMVDSWEAHYGITSPTAQDDGDSENNLAEFVAHTNPVNAASNLLDRDGDGLNDPDFELYYFADLDETGSGDPDGDFSNNELEETSFTNPLSAASWPDIDDGDGGQVLNDGWEEYYFGDRDGVIEAGELAQTPTGDPDGDGEDNLTEYNNRTDPTNWFSRAVVPPLFTMIGGSTRNGQFELQGPAPGVASGTKRASWDQAGAADVTYWTEWVPYNTAPNNSGVEGGTGLQHAFMEGGNAVYNLTDYKAAQGNIYWFAFDKQNGNRLDAYLVYEDAAGAIQPITASLYSSTTTGNNQLKGYQIPAGSPAIGRRIGIGFRSFASWAAFDNVRLGVAPGDADADGYDDTYEDYVWGDNDGQVEASDRAAGPAGDVDGDGIPTLVELDGSANTLYGNQPTKPNVFDSDGDGLSDGRELNPTTGTKTNPNVADTDGDLLNDKLEVDTYGTDPRVVDSDLDGFADGVEVLYYGTEPDDINSVPDVQELVGLNKRNGSFELLGAPPGTVNGAKAANWDTAAAGDVTYWTIWTEQSTASNDSGTEANGSTFRHGAKHAYLQSGNAVYNLSAYQIKAGDVIRLTYSRTAAGTLSAYLVANNGTTTVQIPGSTIQVTTATGDGNELVFVVPNGHASIGQSLGVAFKNTGGGNTFPGLDKVVLSVQDRDSDGDGLSDFWEDFYWGGADDLVLASELNQAKGTAAQVLPGSADNDADGFNNEAEETAGSNPLSATSIPGDLDGDGLGDAWEITNFGSTTAQTGAGDPDGDGTDNATEFRLGLNPNNGSSGFKVTAVQKGTSSFSLTWPSVTGVTFKIERSTSMASGSWTLLNGAFPGTAGTATYIDNSLPADTKAFYKVTLNP